MIERIRTQLNQELTKILPEETEVSVVALTDYLLPYVFEHALFTHKESAQSIITENENISFDDALVHPLMQKALTDSLEYVLALYKTSFIQFSSEDKADEVIARDAETLLRSHVNVSWGTLRTKTLQELQNDVHPGNAEEKVYLWVQEIQKQTGIYSETSEKIGDYVKRAIATFLQKTNMV